MFQNLIEMFTHQGFFLLVWGSNAENESLKAQSFTACEVVKVDGIIDLRLMYAAKMGF